MNIERKSKIQLEILISTMNRSSLDFLQSMFSKANIDLVQILIVNQTTKDKLLKSDSEKIRIINSFEKGLSRSRNLAISNAIGDICLLADDDVIFHEDFHHKITESYNQLPQANLLTFKTLTKGDKPFSSYPSEIRSLNGFEAKVLSIEITFKRDAILKNKYVFNEHFGLGATFEDSENFLFLRTILGENKLDCFFIPEYIVTHTAESSSDQVSEDRYIFARSALNYKLKGRLSYFYVFKLLFSLLRKKKIAINQLLHKYKIAKDGIATYKSIVNEP